MSDDGGLEIREVGANFHPGPEANAAIAQLLGYEAEVKDDKRAYFYDVDRNEIPSHAPEWKLCLDYCEDVAAVAELMEFENRVPYIKPLKKEPGQKKLRYICIFDHDGDVCVTTSFMKASHALAAALYFVLSEHKS